MASQGPQFPATAVTSAVSGQIHEDWLNINNIKVADGVEAQITADTFDSPDVSFRIRARSFGFTIPLDATITGIVVEVNRRCFAGAARDFNVRLTDDTGTAVTGGKESATAWPGTLTVQTYGGAADTWSFAGWTPTIINSTGFSVHFSVEATAANTDVGVDYIRVTVHYVIGTTGGRMVNRRARLASRVGGGLAA